MSRLKAKKIKRIVVRGTNWVGDAVMTIPALRELRRLFPESTITLATQPLAKGLFAGAEYIDDLLIYGPSEEGSVIEQINEWKRREFDLAILFQNAFKAALIAAAARVPFRIGYAGQWRRALLTQPLPLPEWRETRHEIYYYLNIVAEIEALLGWSSQKMEPDCSINIPPGNRLNARNFLQGRGLQKGTPAIVFCPGSINSRAKRWPAERYAELGDRLVEDCDARILLIGSKGELEISQKVSSLMHNKPIVLTGETDLAELIAILDLVDLVVTNDTGPAHIATALGRPTLVIFGPTNPATTRPFGRSAQILRHPPECAPCMLRDCPIDHRCMTAITPDEVFERARNMLVEGQLLKIAKAGNIA